MNNKILQRDINEKENNNEEKRWNKDRMKKNYFSPIILMPKGLEKLLDTQDELEVLSGDTSLFLRVFLYTLPKTNISNITSHIQHIFEFSSISCVCAISCIISVQVSKPNPVKTAS